MVLVIDEGNDAQQILGIYPGAVHAVIVGVVEELALLGSDDVRNALYSM
jgi:hypothetical protein